MRRVTSPPLLMTVSGCSVYLGAALGIGLFDHIGPAGVAWLRVVGAALVFVAIVRPRRAAWTGRAMVAAGSFGTVTALMNIFFYEAIARIPLGTAVAIEFVGPIVVGLGVLVCGAGCSQWSRVRSASC